MVSPSPFFKKLTQLQEKRFCQLLHHIMGASCLHTKLKRQKVGLLTFPLLLLNGPCCILLLIFLPSGGRSVRRSAKKNCTNRRATTRLFCNARKLFLQAWCAIPYSLIRVLRIQHLRMTTNDYLY